MREMLFHASSMRGSSAFHPHTAGHTICLAPACATSWIFSSVASGSYCQFSSVTLFGRVSRISGISTAISPQSMGSRPCLDRCSQSLPTYVAYSAATPTRCASCFDLPLPRSKVSSAQMLNRFERKSCRYESTSCAENAKARSSATLSVWCLMRSMKLNGRSASSGNSPSSRSSCVRIATYWCPNVETDGTSSMPRFAQYWSNSSVSAGVSGLDPRHVSLIPSNANVCSMYSCNWLYL